MELEEAYVNIDVTFSVPLSTILEEQANLETLSGLLMEDLHNLFEYEVSRGVLITLKESS